MVFVEAVSTVGIPAGLSTLADTGQVFIRRSGSAFVESE
jgi:hypothetical protein